LPQRGGRFFASARIRTGGLYLSERQRADIGITAKARQRYALCQFESGYQLQKSGCPTGAAAFLHLSVFELATSI